MSAVFDANFKTPPFKHQLLEFETSADLDKRALLWQMRSGKTKVCIDTACYLFETGKIDAVMVIAPNGVHDNWAIRELPKHHWETSAYKALSWNTSIAGNVHRKKRAYKEWHSVLETMLKPAKHLQWFMFNVENIHREDVKKIAARIVKTHRVLIIFDESHEFRTPGSKRTKMARALTKRCKYRRILTGTNIHNSPLNAFSQFELLEPGCLGDKNYGTFKQRYSVWELRQRAGRSFPVVKEYINMDVLQQRIAEHSSVVLRKDCADMPDIINRSLPITLTEQQKETYDSLLDFGTGKKLTKVTVDGKPIEMNANTVKLVKFQQVASGFIVDGFGDYHDIPGGNPRLDVLMEEVHLQKGKVIIWCRFRYDMDQVYNRLLVDGFKAIQYHGRVSSADKQKARELFAPDAENDIKALVGYPTLGIDLSAASQIIWYSHVFDTVLREQADERATAIGGKNVILTDLVAPGIDRYILNHTMNKKALANTVVGEGLRDLLNQGV